MLINNYFFYSVDSRDKKLSAAVHWSEQKILGHRGKFIFKKLTEEDKRYLTAQSRLKNIGSSNFYDSLGSSSRFFGTKTPKKVVQFNYTDGLLLKDVAISDEGDYHCRVDFHNSPTNNVRIRLHVVGEYDETVSYNYLQDIFIPITTTRRFF